MSSDFDAGHDTGGDPPCWSHLFDDADPLGSVEWSALVDQLADAVIAADPTGTITYWNRAAERVFGWPAGDAVGHTLDLIIPERFRSRHWDGYHDTVATGITRYGERLLEVPALHRDGHRIYIAFTVTLARDQAGTIERVVAVIRDDTVRWEERKQLRAELADLREGASGQ